ncbi:MAG: o-succinylbenzoate synthase, partial [bacterium]
LCQIIKFFLDQGYERIKIKIKPEKDVEVVKAIREEFGDFPLQVDANAGYLKGNAQVLEELDKFSLLMIEQPLSARDFVGHSELQKRIKTPICLDESIVYEEDVETAYKLGAGRVINIKPARVGGIYPACKLAEKARQLGFSCWVGGLLETGIGRAANLSLACLPYFNYPGDISASDRYFVEDIIDPPFILQKGSRIQAPSAPGLGVAPVLSRLKHFGVKIHQWQ